MACKIPPEVREKNKKKHAELKENFDRELAEYWRRKDQEKELRQKNRRVKSEAHAASGDSYSQWLKAVEALPPPRNNISDSELNALLE